MNNVNDSFENNIDEDKIVRKFRSDIIIFLVIVNAIVFLILMFMPTTMAKPAIYLYPQKPTKIDITLSKTILIGTNIPKYHNGWNVMAYSNGKIIDLQPKYTDCNKLKQNKVGFEYAYNACINNNYPYIFWDGRQITKPVPKKQEGWVINQSEIQTFLNEKLDKIGFNSTEKIDFISYWQYKLHQQNSKYYFIYFLQNEEVDDYAPMNINPKPNSINRILMIVQPIGKPIKVNEQKLQKISRRGFSVVDWGGILKRDIWGDKID